MSDRDQVLHRMRRVVNAHLSDLTEPLTQEIIRGTIGDFRCLPAYGEITDQEAEKLAREIEESQVVAIGDPLTLAAKGHEPWLDAAKAGIDPYYWSRYRDMLSQRGWSKQVIAKMNEVSDRILDLMENPQTEGVWDRRGLVMGNVQSGKTANYLGLICKAADAGYRVVIVIAGIHNNLRNQTQSRVDEGFVGNRVPVLQAGGRMRERVGVGLLDFRRRPASFTSATRDFNAAGANQVGVDIHAFNEPMVFVIKKNPTTLKNLINWLKESQKGDRISAPLLVIDDEADNASINVARGIAEATKINSQIRQLLAMFERSCYVGYTATPFANIFIDPDTEDEMLGADLFPKDFLVSLDAPSNYFGASRVFLSNPLEHVRFIEDSEDLLPLSHKKDLQIVGLPESLLDAVRCFVLARAIRLDRGQGSSHNSMLVNASRFTDVQDSLRDEIDHFLEGVKHAARLHAHLPANQAEADPEISELKRVWQAEYSESGSDWKTLLPQLHESAAPIRVVTVNSRSSGTLRYEEAERHGLNAIAVGGLSLSRGLTLEGLVVSYFLRNTMMYDTLMQMGRWFGFRPGYEDLCRVWMPEESAGHYEHVAESIEMLRSDLKRMEQAGATPAEFGLRVRSHPDALMVTARNKMRGGTAVPVRIGLANSFVETTALRRDAQAHNLAAAARLVSRLYERNSEGPTQESFGWLFPAVPSSVVTDFLREFRNDRTSLLSESEPVIAHIEERVPGELETWDVLVASLKSGDDVDPWTIGQLQVNPQSRKAGTKTNESTIRVGNNQRVATRGIEQTGLTPSQVEAAQAGFAPRDTKVSQRGINYPDRIYREIRPRPLLVVHVLRITDDAKAPKADSLAAAWSISFPPTELDQELVEYVVNVVWLREYYKDEFDDEEQVGDD